MSHDCRFVKDIPTSIIQKLSQRIWRIPPIPVYIFVATIKAGTGQTRLTAQFFFHRANIVIFSIFTPSCIYCYKQMTKFFVPQGYANFSYLELHLRRLSQYISSYISHIYIFFENISWTLKSILILIFSRYIFNSLNTYKYVFLLLEIKILPRYIFSKVYNKNNQDQKSIIDLPVKEHFSF